MKIESAFTTGRAAGVNLDRFVVNEDFAAVFDGATPKHADATAAGRATNELMDMLVDAVHALDPHSTAQEVLDALTAVATPLREPFSPSAAGAVYSRHLGKVLVISDTWVSVDGVARFYGHALEPLFASIRVAFTQLALATGADRQTLLDEDPGRRAILDLLGREREFRNVDGAQPFAFAGIDGSPIPLHLVQFVDVARDARRLVLASDGYVALGADLDSTERFLAERLLRDPLMIEDGGGTKALLPGGVSFDDRTYLSLILSDVPRS